MSFTFFVFLPHQRFPKAERGQMRFQRPNPGHGGGRGGGAEGGGGKLALSARAGHDLPDSGLQIL